MAVKKLERVYTIPLRVGFIKVPRYYRAKRAVNQIRKYIEKHMKTDDVRIGKYLNEYVWAKGITNPPGKVTVKTIREDGYVTVELEGHEYRTVKVQTEKTDKPTSFKEKLAAKLKTDKSEDSVVESEKKDDSSKEVKESEGVVSDKKVLAKESKKESVDKVDSKN